MGSKKKTKQKQKRKNGNGLKSEPKWWTSGANLLIFGLNSRKTTHEYTRRDRRKRE